MDWRGLEGPEEAVVIMRGVISTGATTSIVRKHCNIRSMRYQQSVKILAESLFRWNGSSTARDRTSRWLRPFFEDDDFVDASMGGFNESRGVSTFGLRVRADDPSAMMGMSCRRRGRRQEVWL